jgi:hypothetical protein
MSKILLQNRHARTEKENKFGKVTGGPQVQMVGMIGKFQGGDMA